MFRRLSVVIGGPAPPTAIKKAGNALEMHLISVRLNMYLAYITESRQTFAH